MKQEYWNATKEIIKPVYFDENNFSIEERNALEQAFTDLKRKVEREITLHTTKGLIVTREYVTNIIDHFFNKVPEAKNETLNQFIERFIKEIKNGDRYHDKHGQMNHYGMEQDGMDTQYMAECLADFYSNRFDQVHSILVYKDGMLVFEEYMEGNKYAMDGLFMETESSGTEIVCIS